MICIVLAKKWYGKDWFEMAMGAYGQCTGSLATGLLLIKVLDPNGDTLAAESVSGSSTLGSFWQQPYNTIGPMMILASPVLVTPGNGWFSGSFPCSRHPAVWKNGKKVVEKDGKHEQYTENGGAVF